MSSLSITLDGASLSIDEVVRVARDPSSRVALAPDAEAGVARSRSRIDTAVERGEAIYGVNTGFGKLAHVRIPPDALDRLQVNLIRSHCAGVGDPLPAACCSERTCCSGQRAGFARSCSTRWLAW
jgi:histidine ammonia-lyase